jgi:hypothetical protein
VTLLRVCYSITVNYSCLILVIHKRSPEARVQGLVVGLREIITYTEWSTREAKILGRILYPVCDPKLHILDVIYLQYSHLMAHLRHKIKGEALPLNGSRQGS